MSKKRLDTARHLSRAVRVPAGRALARSARGAVAADRQTGAAVHARAAARTGENARPRGSQRAGLAAQRVGVVVRVVPRRASAAGRARASAKIVPIVGLDYKDESAAGKRWLADNGDPYTVSVVDGDGRVGIDWGVYGVPETFVDRQGGSDPLQADRTAHRGSAREEDRAAHPRAAEIMICVRSLISMAAIAAFAWSASCSRRKPHPPKRMRSSRRAPCGSPKSSAVSSARTRPSRIPTPSSRRTCAGRFASRSPPARRDDEIIAYMVARYGDFVLVPAAGQVHDDAAVGGPGAAARRGIRGPRSSGARATRRARSAAAHRRRARSRGTASRRRRRKGSRVTLFVLDRRREWWPLPSPAVLVPLLRGSAPGVPREAVQCGDSCATSCASSTPISPPARCRAIATSRRSRSSCSGRSKSRRASTLPRARALAIGGVDGGDPRQRHSHRCAAALSSGWETTTHSRRLPREAKATGEHKVTRQRSRGAGGEARGAAAERAVECRRVGDARAHVPGARPQ